MKKWFKMIIVGFVAVGSLVSVPALAQTAPPVAEPCGSDLSNDPLALDCVSNADLSAADPRIIASRIINVVLGVLGTIATILIFYAGFLWMTAAGDDDQIGKSKSIMTAAIIGLVVILASYSISTFFVKSAYQAVNDTTYQTP